MKVAIVHDFLNQYGGAERVVEAIKEIYPNASVYTSIYSANKMPELMKEWKIVTPNIKGFPFFRKLIKYYTFLLPLMFENIDLHDYDVIISSTANFAKGVITRSSQLHICYCHTPPRFLYHYDTEFNRRKISIYKPFLILLDHYLRLWDFLASSRVDYFLTNSENTKNRITKFYRRDSTVIYPPVSLSFQEKVKNCDADEKYFLIVSRLAEYKKIDLAIKACNELNLNLKIIGSGRELNRLKKISGSTISFLGSLSDSELSKAYINCQAFIFPAEDDFGIAPVEAMLYGRPVIAFGKGGALETVVPGKTGEFFYESSVESLKAVLKSFNSQKYNSKGCQDQAQKFNKDSFKKKIRLFIEEKWKEKNHARTTGSGNN